MVKEISVKVELVKSKIEEAQKLDTCGHDLFPKGSDRVFKHLKFNAKRVIEDMDEAVSHWLDMTSQLISGREKLIFEAEQSDSGNLSDASLECKYESLMLAYGTFRKVEIFGNEHAKNINFEWPAAADMLLIRSLKDLQLTGISVKQFNGYLSGIQLHYKNGLDSPPFLSNNCLPELFTTHRLDTDNEVHKVIAKVQTFGSRTHGILGLDFISDSDQVLLHAEFDEIGSIEERVLNPGEKIVGVYGSKNRKFCDYIDSLGFIVWRP